MELLYKNESYRIMGACFEVYKEKGCGFSELVYQECLEIEFALQAIPFRSRPDLRLTYKGRQLKQYFVPDFLLFDQIILEIKAAKDLADEHRGQVFNYLKASDLRLGLLVNFGHYPKVQSERFVL